ncbi:MAG: glycosyltransferase, partial [Lactobacillus sp.]|nr:glycosyltransferase [Lactobacillus sp.]
MEISIAVIFSCHNRKTKTINAIESLGEKNPNIKFVFYIVDDNSRDGTKEALEELQKDYNIFLLHGSGQLFYTKCMHLGMKRVKESQQKYQYVLLINDDVSFYDFAVENLIIQSQAKRASIIVGATEDEFGKQNYGAIKYKKHSIHYTTLSIEDHSVEADTFNGNCVLIPWEIFSNYNIMDDYYMHGAGDFDYGMYLSRKGIKIYSSAQYVGVCYSNQLETTCQDCTLPVIKRFQLKETPKGLPFKD